MIILSIIDSLLSLGLGFLSWGLGAAAIAKKGKPWLVFSSMGACCGALLVQLLEVYFRAARMDASAIYDTIGAVVFAAATLITVTVVLNGIALVRGRQKKAGRNEFRPYKGK